MPPEPKAVAEGQDDLLIPRLVGDEVQVAFLIRFVQVDRRGNEVSLDGQGGDDRLNAAAGAQEMA